jgi:hypothetical protein
MTHTLRALIAVNVLLTLSIGAFAQSPAHEFSADIVSRDAAGAIVGASAKLHVANHKVRIDPADGSGEFFITDDQAGTALFVRPAQRLFMDAGQSSTLTQIFVNVDLHDPCRQWQAAALVARTPVTGPWQCERIKSDSASNPHAIEYSVQAPRQAISRSWINPGLNFPILWQASDGTKLALENIRIGPQPPGLFAVPAEYRKFDPAALIERIKHSDVWAGPPNR